ncbi:MAG: hypothetical protein M1825_002451 [Sarcosagium campestre]|nr:MAG: hypothetical protein M1825_002451 [Sarcosagium campestre]
MADADEDSFRLPQDGEDNRDNLEDETQDFRFISALAESDSNHLTIPRRGLKDFEPHGTSAQASLLNSSRQAMHTALSATRVHAPRSHMVGRWHPSKQACCIDRPKGQFSKTMGQADRSGRLWLLPEEMLYLLERGSLDARWVDADAEDSEHEETENRDEVPMSLQAAYSVCIGAEDEGRIPLERWNVYAGLKRSGYTVLRASSWGTSQADGTTMNSSDASPQSTIWGQDVVKGFLSRLFTALTIQSSPPAIPPSGPLVSPGLYRNYNDIYKRLRLIPYHDATCPTSTPTPQAQTTTTTHPFRIAFHVWKPGHATFKKTNLPPPDFRIAVVSARDPTATMPTQSQLAALLGSTPYAPPPAASMRHLEQRLRHGWRNVILAVVDQGVVSYLRISEACFAHEPLNMEPAARGGRGGKRGGGRGRGRGRGRGSGRGR